MIIKEVLKEVVISQEKFLNSLEPTITREKEKEIGLQESFALFITGIRRCGKSTLMNQLFKQQTKGYYLNLEDPRLEGFELLDFNKIELIMKEFYGEKGVYFFDEIQNIEKWEKFIRYLVDKKKKSVNKG